MKKSAVLGTLAALSAMAGVGAYPFAGPRHIEPCPKCTRGKLVGSNVLRYCQRCAFVVKQKAGG